jgi:hypothetical protein
MSKHGPARAVLTGAVIVALAGCALAGCSDVPAGTRPDVPSPGGSMVWATGSRSAGHATSSGASAASRASGTAPPTTQPGAPAAGFAQANSIPFPVAVGNTWIYQTNAGGQTGRTTNTIVGAGPGSAGYRVTVSSTTDFGGSASTVTPVYTFYPDGTIGYPVPRVSDAPVAGGSIRWPDVTGLASGQVYHSVLRIQGVNANVTVQGAGTAQVSVPAGSYRASVVKTTITADGQTVEVTVWIAQGTGPVKTEVVIRAPGGTGLTTSELLSFTKAAGVAGAGS